ncbi:hypothetical protein K432DRAFT_340909, partial [Lepidopterella palustris CBS 459.81]
MEDQGSLEALLYQINHIFLPPQLPQEDDKNVLHEKALMKTVYHGLIHFRRSLVDQRCEKLLTRCTDMMKRMMRIHDANGLLDSKLLEKELLELDNFGFLAIHVRSQNAGLLVTKIDSQYLFESLELLARDTDVMACKGRLRRHFPGRSVAVDAFLVRDTRFRETLIDTLIKLDRERDSEGQTKPKARDAYGNDLELDREEDTTDPRLVTGMLMAVLQGLGRIADVPRICKHTREEVLLKRAHSPWRRSPLWLFIRVSMQLNLYRQGAELVPGCQGESLYKEFMLFLMSFILNHPASSRLLPHDLLFIMMAKISRRIIKHGSAETAPWFEFTKQVMKEKDLKLKLEWDDMQKKESKHLNLSALHSLDFGKD